MKNVRNYKVTICSVVVATLLSLAVVADSWAAVAWSGTKVNGGAELKLTRPDSSGRYHPKVRPAEDGVDVVYHCEDRGSAGVFVVCVVGPILVSE